MSVSPEFRNYIVEQLSTVATVRTRSMFGGAGIYAGDRFFAIIADDVLYFKAGEENRGDFEGAGMKPFRPYGRQTMQYYEVPPDVLEDVEQLRLWMKKSLAVASRGGASRRSSRRSVSRSRR